MTEKTSRPASQMQPRLAIVVPVFKHSVLLTEAIESALAQLADFQIHVVVVNDGCPHPETEAVCAEYALSYPRQLTYLRKPNGGLSSARNHGIRYALAKWPALEAVYLLDADNRIRSVAMAKAMALMTDTGCDWVYPSLDMFGMRRTADFGGDYSTLVQTGMNICEAGSLIARRVFEAGVMFDEDMRLGFEDWDFFLSAGSKGFVGHNLDDFGFLYRKRPESMLADSNRDQDEIKSGMLRKHRGLMSPKNLVRLEQREAPRYAIYLADEHKYMLTVDPGQPGVEMSTVEFERLVWSSWTARSRNHAPAFLVVTNRNNLDALREMRLLHWSLWRLEDGLRSQPVATLSYRMNESERFLVEENVSRPGDHLEATLLMLSPQSFGAVIRDVQSTWIDSLVMPGCEPPVFNLSISYPLGDIAAAEPVPSVVVQSLLEQVHSLRRSRFRKASDIRWDWRDPAVPLRNTSHEYIRQKFKGAPAMPRLNLDGRQIGFLLPLVEFGGVEKVTHGMAAAFRTRGWTPHLFVLNRQEAALQAEQLAIYESVSFLCDDSLDDYSNAESYQGTAISNWAQSERQGRALGLLHWLDVVVNCHGAALSGLMGQLRRMDIKTAVSLHLNDLTSLGRSVGNTYVALAHEHAYDYFVTCSNRLADWCRGMGVPTQKVIAAPNAGGYPVTLEESTEILGDRATRVRTGLPLRVLFIGRLDRQKGMDRLCEVIRICRDSRMAVEWRLVGKAVLDDTAGSGLPADIDALVEPPVHSSQDLNDVYQWADILVLPSYYEGLPLTIIEAMRLGVVVIATDVGAVSEVVRDGINGILLRGNDVVDACCQAISGLSSNAAQLAAFSLAASSSVSGRTWEMAISGLAERLESFPLRDEVPAKRKLPAEAI